MKILNFGSCNIDYVYKVDSIVKPGETICSRDLSIHAGGKGLNQSLAIARSGSDVWHAGCIGADGQHLKKLLEQSGVNTKFIKVTDMPTGHAAIQVDKNGENSIVLYNGANHAVSKEYADYVLDRFLKDDVLVLQNEISNTEHIITKAYDKGMRIFLNPSPVDRTIIDTDLSKIHFLILNKIEAREISGKTDQEEIFKYLISQNPELNIVMTLGNSGSIFLNREKKVFSEAYKVRAVDTTGAGDTFLGYFVSNYIKTEDADGALNAAGMAAALAVTKNGAAESIPYKDEVTSAFTR